MQDKKKISLPILVEGKYDKNTLSQIFDANIITLGGFSVFNSKEKQSLIRKIAKNGIIIMTDSDGGGRQIRSFLLGILPPEKVKNVHIPKLAGKERRKTHPSRSGLLGVEGMERELLEKLLSPFVDGGGRDKLSLTPGEKSITKQDLYFDGLSGGEGSAIKRRELCRYLEFPEDMSAKALLEALNLAVGYSEYKRLVLSLNEGLQ